VIQTLKKLAETGRTVIISIHAPRSEIWKLFDRVILLSREATLYSGLADAAAPHFQQYGYELPAFVNPAEFLIDLAAIDNRSEEAEQISYARVSMLKEAWQQKPQSEKILDASPYPPITQSADDDIRHMRVGFCRQLYVLAKRNTKVTVRDPMGVAGSLFEAVVMSIMTGWIFLRLGSDLAGIRSREGAIYTAASLQGYLILMFETYRLTIDIKLFDRERSEGVVTAPAFLLSRRISRLFLEDLPVPIIFATIYYFMAGFRADATTYFIFLAVTIICQFITVTLASLCVAVARDFATASLIGNLSYTLQSFSCGYFVQSQQIPVYTRWLKWVVSIKIQGLPLKVGVANWEQAYNFYVFGSLAENEFIGADGGYFGQFYACPHSTDPTDPECQQYVGRYIMDSLGLPSNWLWRPILVAISFAVAFFFGAMLVLTFWRVDIDIARARKDSNALLSGKQNAVSSSSQEVRRVAIGLDGYGLEVHKRHLWKRSYNKTILNPIVTSFEPAQINVIMGPSGCGKTSLLQSLAQRLNGDLFSVYRPCGSITLNGAIPSTSVIESVTSFVTQDDDALLPLLTVRETLRFAAGLRLPPFMSKREKYRRAEDVILKMGLKDCADNLIGSEFKKGISGGEKRRVSIAIQILTDPKVLLLDEPTSGLDTFTATSVVDVLKTLAEEGRTIIMTIHQARSDLFKSFHNILLLSRGGSAAYSGSGRNMLPHFRSLGFECPRTTNPADFVLDLITIDLQQQDRETASREKVERIIQEWETVQPPLARRTSKIAAPAELSSLKKQANPFRVTFPLVLQRSAINIRRNPEILLARTMQVIGIGILLALFFAPLQANAEAVQSRMVCHNCECTVTSDLIFC
jgi:ABC-type multidrug transport system ATPase subunit